MQKDDEQIEVSYTLLTIGSSEKSKIIEKIAVAINVQLSITEDGLSLPFAPPNSFENAAKLDKLFIYGASGCGKSRAIFEIAKGKLQSVEKIYIINPRQHTTGEESGRIALTELMNRLTENDMVVWDNFPDDLMKKDIDNGRKSLEIISSRDVKCLMIALKPKYLEMYKSVTRDIPELRAFEIVYDKLHIEDILVSYGDNVTEFLDLYRKHIEPDVDKIASLLWEKEPLPLTVLNYYKELLQKRGEVAFNQFASYSIDAVAEAKMLLPRSEYYEHQFQLIQDQADREIDAEFLYALKLCYELGLDRTINVVERFQKDIFGSASPKDATRTLGSWVYLAGQQYSMHDAPREAIKVPDYVRIKTTNYLLSSFFNVIPTQDHQLRSVGIFFGKHLNLIADESVSGTILPEDIYQFMKSNRHFEEGLGQGAGEVFSHFQDHLQQTILARTDTDMEFAKAFGDSLANSFPHLSKKLQIDILDRLKKNVPFSRGFGESLGRNFTGLTHELQDQVFAMLSVQENFQFTRGVGMGLGRRLVYLSEELQQKVFSYTHRSQQFAVGIGFGLGNIFTNCPREFRQLILERASRNGEIARGLGTGLGRTFRFLSKEFQATAFCLMEKSFQFAFGLGGEISNNFEYLGQATQKQVLELTETNTGFAWGIAAGLGPAFAHKPAESQEWLFELAKRNSQFGFGLAYGYGRVFNYLPKSLQEKCVELIQKNSQFASGLGYGLGYIFIFLDKELQQRLFEKANKNSQFIFGLGNGLGFIFEQLSSDLKEKLLNKAQHSSMLMRGIGLGIGTVLNFMDKDCRQSMLRQSESNLQLAAGLGEGIGEPFVHFTEEHREEMLSFAKHNKGFAQGLACRLGQTFDYLEKDLQQKMLQTLVKEDYEFAYGLGFGLGTIFTHLSKDTRKEAMQASEHNIALMRGIGAGLGFTFQFLPNDIQKQTLEQADKHALFSVGLGEGVGRILPYLPEIIQEKQFDRISTDGPFAKGLGYGLGSMFSYLPEAVADRISRYVEGHVEFAYGFGEGMAVNFPFMNEDFQRASFVKAGNSAKLAEGFGCGIGSIFQYLDRKTQEDILKMTLVASAWTALNNQQSSFVKGLGMGFGFDMKYLSQELRRDIFETANDNKQFAFGLGYGLAIDFAYLGVDFQNVLAEDKQKIVLGQGMGFGTGHIFSHLPASKQKFALNELAKENEEFAKGLANGIGQSLPVLSPSLQEYVLDLAGRQGESEFAQGLGSGIGRSFGHLDATAQHELLVWIHGINSPFTKNLGAEIGRSFASLSPQIQQQILLEYYSPASGSSEFAKGFGEGLKHSFEYLNKQLQEQIFKELGEERVLSLLQEKHSAADSLYDSTIYESSDFSYPNLVTIKSEKISQDAWITSEEEISFSGLRENYCVCFIDMMNSTKIASNLTGARLDKYYSIFLNAMATIVRNFGGKIIKNAGDALIYYFPDTADPSDTTAFKDVLECGITMIAAHGAVNSKMQAEGLPALNYRISAEYGMVAVARSKSSNSGDLFGSAMNICAKINSKAPANGMVVGKELYQSVKSIEDFRFEKIDEQQSDSKSSQYPAYIVQTREKRNIINPFKRTRNSKSEDSL